MGRGRGRGRGGGRGAPFAVFAAMEETVPVKPIGEAGAAQPRGGARAAQPGEENVALGGDAPPSPPLPQLAEVMNR
jgi:hypothetical protein